MRRVVPLTLVCTLTAFVGVALGSSSGRIGVVPPAVPAANCVQRPRLVGMQNKIDYCRAYEGVGAIVLPTNWGSLSVREQLLVLIDLERVNRGLAPDVGLSPGLDTLAQQGAAQDRDPSFPALRRRRPELYDSGGSIWADNQSSIGADFFWMYEDGYGAGNEACAAPGDAGCWGHRGIILSDMGSGPLVGGGGYAHGNSFAFEQLYGQTTKHLVFTWAAELRHFRAKPKLERLGSPTVTSISPASGSAGGGTLVTIRGSGLAAAERVRFGTERGVDLSCKSNSDCTVRAPAGPRGRVSVTVSNPAGYSKTSKAARFSYR
jgi:IPT/TIG domain-containing protein